MSNADPAFIRRAELSLAIASLQLAVADSLPGWLFGWRSFLEGCAVARRMEAFETIKEWERLRWETNR